MLGHFETLWSNSVQNQKSQITSEKETLDASINVNFSNYIFWKYFKVIRGQKSQKRGQITNILEEGKLHVEMKC